MQMIALGHDVDVVDSETGESIKHVSRYFNLATAVLTYQTGQPGELICRQPFPSMPLIFWNDPEYIKYSAAYFDRFPSLSVWAQHDWIQFNLSTSGSQIHGRSDGTLNPSGIRFGSSEIYSVVEDPNFAPGLILDTLCVGRKRQDDKDEVVFLFVKMCEGKTLDGDLVAKIRGKIRSSLSPRHVPTYIIQVKDIPCTINGKKVEIAVKKVISGTDVKLSATVANPESLEEYYPYKNHGDKVRAKL
jgi:acetoacetyl-CoA synthetase